ncbi:MAG: carbohydrate kinase family protein [Chloroflexota bacterium]
MKSLLVISGASLDILHFSGQTARSAGGSGMYTASAAHRMGGQVSLLGPYPDVMPELLQPFTDRVNWFGPVVPVAELPHFEILHEEEKTTYLTFFSGAEADLTPDSLPDDLSQYTYVHIGPLGTAARQRHFFDACKRYGARKISVNCFGPAAEHEADTVRRLIKDADLFFCNEDEATYLFGSTEQAKTEPGKLLFVTLGAGGANVIQGDHTTHIPAPVVNALDVTGAGDTFSGTTLMGLADHQHPIIAARRAVQLAAQMIQFVGPTALWQEEAPITDTRDQRVIPNETQINRVSKIVAELPDIQPFNYSDANFPPIGHPKLLDFLFTAVLQQFSFWKTKDGRYHQPLIAPIAGKERKGSDFLWQAYLRPLESDPAWYSPAHQAALTQNKMEAHFQDDDGSMPMPALDLHLSQAQAYGRDMLALNLTPAKIVEHANRTDTPLATFLETLTHIGGYKEDYLQKKVALLAVILIERPEKLLCPAPDEVIPPIIDYHLQRSCLRTGIIDVVDNELHQKLEERRILPPADEQAVREAAYDAIQQVAARSSKSMAAVDWFFFNARRYCPEMSEPLCDQCLVDSVCAHRKTLFQPVLRTTFY